MLNKERWELNISPLRRKHYRQLYLLPCAVNFKWLNLYFNIITFIHSTALGDNGTVAPKTRFLDFNSIKVRNPFVEVAPIYLEPLDHFKSALSPEIIIKNVNFDWFKGYWRLYQTKGSSQYQVNRDFKVLFFICTDQSSVYDLIGLQKFYLRWEAALNLMFNLAFHDARLVAFSNKIFIEEALAFNWSLNLQNFKLFKFSQSILYFKDSAYGEQTEEIYDYIRDNLNWEAALVTDVKAHEKNLFFLQRSNIFQIGLVPANYSPSILSFGVPLMGESLLGQHYFFNVALRMTLSGRSYRFRRLQTHWTMVKRIIRLYLSPTFE